MFLIVRLLTHCSFGSTCKDFYDATSVDVSNTLLSVAKHPIQPRKE